MNKIIYTSGAYENERDNEGDFRWLSDKVEIQVDDVDGLLVLVGQAPLLGQATVRTAQMMIEVHLTPGEMTFAIPVRADGMSQTVSIEFAQSLHAPDDTRTLCFKARSVDLRSAKKSSGDGNSTGLVEGRGLYTGAVGTTFADGWLRMHATSGSDNLLKLSGVLHPPLHRRESLVLTANGVPLSNISYGLTNPDYAYLGCVAFEGTVDISSFVEQGGIRFGSVFEADGQPATPAHQDWYWSLSGDDAPIPESANMQRIGSTERDWFLFSGASFVEKIDEVVGIHDRKAIHVLDWGCGCGRLTRHLLNKGYGDITGIDIDPFNIDWCRSSLPDAEFTLVSPDVPTPLSASSVDLVIGHSVFTHLSEVDQFLWLAELNRLIKPGGHALVTLMTNFSAAIDSFEIDYYTALQRNGFLDVGWQQDGVDSQKPGFYRRVFHTIDYVLRHWLMYFEVRAVLEGYSDHQNAILLRKSA